MRGPQALAAVRGSALIAVLAGAAHATWLLATQPATPLGALETCLASIGADLGLALLCAPLVILVALALPADEPRGPANPEPADREPAETRPATPTPTDHEPATPTPTDHGPADREPATPSPIEPPPSLATPQRLLLLATILALELGGAWSLLAWARTHDLAQVTRRVGITLLVWLALTVVLWLTRRARLSPHLLRGAHLLTWLTPLALLKILPASLLNHDGARLTLAIALLLPLAPRLAPRVPRGPARLLLALGALALAWTLLAPRRDPDAASAILTRHEPLRVFMAVVDPLGDLDGDGASILFGGSDCAPLDRFISPHAPELAGNGRDDNCLLGDLADDALPPLPPPGPAWLPHADLLILSVDALRPDRMSIFGYPRATTPNIARHFADAHRFTHAYAEAASTRDTLPSLLSGRRIFDLRWHLDDAVVLDPRTRLLGHALAAAGYHSLGALPFTAVNMIGTARLGLDRLHIYVDHDGAGTSAAGVTNVLLSAHRELPGPRLLFAHYYEPHEPHVPHRRFQSISDAPYDHEVARVDAEIGRLLDSLAARGALDRTIVVLTSDHGEAFDEHGHSFHNVHVFDEDLRVPLLIRVPGHPGRDITTPVSNTQLAATLLELVGVPLPTDDGPTQPSLVPLMRGDSPPEPTITGSARALGTAGKWMLRRGDTKVIFDAVTGTAITFDLAADPGETRPAAPQRELLDDFREHTLGAARSRAFRAMRIGDADDRSPYPLVPGLALVRADAELVDPLDTHPRLPARVLVRVVFDLGEDRPDSFDYSVHLRQGALIHADVDEPIAGGRTSLRAWPPGARIEDVRSFKVVRDRLDAEIIVQAGPHELRLGPIATLPVAPR